MNEKKTAKSTVRFYPSAKKVLDKHGITAQSIVDDYIERHLVIGCFAKLKRKKREKK